MSEDELVRELLKRFWGRMLFLLLVVILGIVQDHNESYANGVRDGFYNALPIACPEVNNAKR